MSVPHPLPATGLRCPKCRDVELVPAPSPDRRHRLDSCPRCRGLWFDGSELGGTLGLAGGADRVPRFALQGKATACPRCRVDLFEYAFPGTEVLVDGCRQCHGAWLDQAEWAQIQAALARKSEVTCPRCGAAQAASPSCMQCGVVFRKFEQRQQSEAEARADLARKVDELFTTASGFSIRQRVEWLEILSPFERANRYEVMVFGQRNQACQVREQSRSILNFFGRQLLGYWRAATLSLEVDEGTELLRMEKRFRLWFHRLDVMDARGAPLGAVTRRFSLLRARYDILDARDRLLIEVKGPIFFMPFIDHVYRFTLGGKEVGQMLKQWRGILREHFTDGDAFRSTVDRSLPVAHKILVFAAVFLIDFGRYEENQG